jgi:hypothetical protein
MSNGQARALGARLRLPPAVAARRLLRAGRARAAASLAPKALSAFTPGALCVAAAGVPVEEAL